jgi:UDP-N-acetylmuramyl pentapeptide synthase
MLELGETSEAQHRELASAIEESGADRVFLAGPFMEALWGDLPEARRGAYAESAGALQRILLDAIGPGDVVMVKASFGTRLGPVVEAIRQRFGGQA